MNSIKECLVVYHIIAIRHALNSENIVNTLRHNSVFFSFF